LRESIKISYPTYYDLKKRIKRTYDNNHNDDQYLGERCATRLFLGQNTFTEAEFRLLMHGQLNFNNNEDEDDETDENEVEEENAQNEEVLNTNNDQVSTIDTEPDIVDSSSKSVQSLISIACNQATSSLCESGFSEPSSSSSSSSSNDTLANNDETISNNEIKSIEPINNNDFDSLNSLENSFISASGSSFINRLFSHKNDSECNLIGNEVEVVEKSEIKTEETSNISNHNVNKSEIKKEDEEEEYINHLRNKILELEIPTALKKFLLYNRDI
jgi:hypothetical protein